MWTGENDLNTVTCGRGSFCNRENIYAVLNLHGYVWTGPYTIHKPRQRVTKYQSTYVKDLADQAQMDLSLKGYYWILTAIELLSRYAFAVPVYRKSTEHTTKAVNEVLGQFKTRFGKYPNAVQFDEGKEFHNVGVKKVQSDKDITYFSSKSTKKAAVVERFNRTLKTRIYHTKTKKWITALPDFVTTYNMTKRSTTKMKPADVNKTNEHTVWLTLYGKLQGVIAPRKFKVGDSVRVISYKTIFAKGYEANFLEEAYEVTQVLRGDPTTYKLKDPDDDEPIFGKFYEQELSLVK